MHVLYWHQWASEAIPVTAFVPRILDKRVHPIVSTTGVAIQGFLDS